MPDKKLTTSLLFFILLLLNHISAPAVYGQKSLDLYFTGGLHGYLKRNPDYQQGGVLDFRNLADQLDLDLENALMFDTGDALAYHYLAKVDSGKSVLENMAQIGWEAMTLGNLDFSYGTNNLISLSGQVKDISLIASNLVGPDSRYPLTKYALFVKNDIRIGVLGLLDPAMKEKIYKGHIENYTILQPDSLLPHLLDELVPRTDFILVLSHMPFARNLELAQRFPEIDLIVGKPESPQKNDFVQFHDENQVLLSSVTKTRSDAKALTQIRLKFQPKGVSFQQTHSAVQHFPLSESLLEKEFRLPEIQDQYRQFTMSRYGANPDSALVRIQTRVQPFDFVRYVLYVLLKSTHSEIAILNHGFFRFDGWLDPRSITIRDIDRTLWSQDRLVIMRLQGKHLLDIYQRSQTFSSTDNQHLYFLAVNGISPSEKLLVHGKPVEPDQVYSVVTTEFLANGGDGYGDGFKHQYFTKSRFTGDLRIVSSDRGEPVWINDLIIEYLTSGQEKPDLDRFEQWLLTLPYLQRPLWILNIDRLDFGMKTNNVYQNERYPKSVDSRIRPDAKNSFSLLLYNLTTLVRETQSSRWQNQLLYRYDRTRIRNEKNDQSPLQTIETNLELESIYDFYHYNRGTRVNPFASLRFDTDHRFEQQDLFGTMGIASIREKTYRMRFGLIGNYDLRTDQWNGGLEFNGQHRLSWSLFKNDLRLRLRYLTSGQQPSVGDEQFSIDLSNGLEIDLTANLKMLPRLDLFIFRDRVLEKVATHLAFSVNLAYSRSWKFQYLKFFRTEEDLQD
jgi:2',3'-cyclic-nucleotide 2'-phosphodiesterase (5'-nucleotidase family)